MLYEINKLRTDRNYFEDFIDELPRDFHKHDIDSFIEYFDSKDTSREIYIVGYPCFTDKQIHELTKTDSTELQAYAQIESGSYRVRLYGTYYLEDYIEGLECYSMASFGDYDYIEIN